MVSQPASFDQDCPVGAHFLRHVRGSHPACKTSSGRPAVDNAGMEGKGRQAKEEYHAGREEIVREPERLVARGHFTLMATGRMKRLQRYMM